MSFEITAMAFNTFDFRIFYEFSQFEQLWKLIVFPQQFDEKIRASQRFLLIELSR